jgi:hypothetical protein
MGYLADRGKTLHNGESVAKRRKGEKLTVEKARKEIDKKV